MRPILWAIAAVLLFSGCEKELPADTKMFSLLSPRETGIDFRNNLVEDIYSVNNVLSYEYYYNGGGVAVGDINNDGLQDIFFTGNTAKNRLFLNKGKFQFETSRRHPVSMYPMPISRLE